MQAHVLIIILDIVNVVLSGSYRLGRVRSVHRHCVRASLEDKRVRGRRILICQPRCPGKKMTSPRPGAGLKSIYCKPACVYPSHEFS